MLAAGSKVDDVTRRRDVVASLDRESHASTFDEHDLLVRMRVHGGDDAGGERETADHHAIAPHHLPCDALGDPLRRNRGPVPLDDPRNGRVHRVAVRAASRPDPSAAKSGCTLTTPYWRSTSSRFAAIIQTKLIALPGAPTFGW